MSEADAKQDQDGQTGGPMAGDAAPAGSAPSEENAAILEADLRRLQEERDALFERVARVQADFRNAQKRLEQEKALAIQFGNTKLIQSLLPVIDNFERAIQVDPAKTDAATLLKGMQVVHDQLIQVLAGQNVEVIDPKPGTPFDPNFHEALMHREDQQYAEPAVVEVLRKGYALFGRLLRPAQVIVSKHS